MHLNKVSSKIIFIENEDLSRNSSGGVMSYILNLSSYFVKEGFRTVLVGSGDTTDEAFLNNKFSEFFSISHKSSLNNLNFFLKLFKTDILKRINKGDVIHVHRPEMVIPLAIRKRNKIICTLHGGQDMAVFKKKGKMIGFFYSILQFISFLLVDQLIVVDKKNLKRYLKKYSWIKKKINLIPISVDINRFYPRNKLESRKKFDLPLDKKIILYIGRLEYEKNVGFIIESFKEIKNHVSQLVIVGSGSFYNELNEASVSHVEQILFFGELDNSSIPEIINSADVLVLTSFFEGSPTVVKESLCCNVPVISTDVGDVKEVLESVNGGEIIDLITDNFIIAIDKIFSRDHMDIKDAPSLFNHNLMGEKTLNIYNKS